MKTWFRKFVLNWIYLPLLRLQYAIELATARRAIRIKNLSILLIEHFLRYYDDTRRLEGFDRNTDKLLFLTVSKLCELQYGKEYQAFESENQEMIQKEIQKALKHTEVKNALAIHFELRALILKVIKKDEEFPSLREKAKQYAENTTEITTKELWKIERAIRKKIIELRNQIADREAFKISIPATHIGTIISVVSTLFLITGYLYNLFFLGAFGVDVSIYFSLIDYLASSIDKIRYAAVGAVLSTPFFFLGVYSKSRKSFLQIEYEQSRKEYWPYLLFLSMAILSAQLYLQNSSEFYVTSGLLLMLIGMYFAPIISRKYFTNPLVVHFILVFLIVFSSYLFGSIGSTVHKYKNADIVSLKKHIIHIDSRLTLSTNTMVILTANRQYYFLYDVVTKRTIILPERYVSYIEPISR